MEVLRLFPAVQQFQVKNGAINTDGRLYVYFNGTDDLADCFDVDGSRIAQPVILDNNGRAPGLFVDADKVYRLEVQDRYGNLLFTVRNMVPTGGGAGSALGKEYDVVSMDGSIVVDKSVDAGVTTFDLSIAPSDSVEFLEWGAAMHETVGEGGIVPVTLTSGTMEMGVQGPKLLKDRYYHITNWMTVIPSGTGSNYETLTVTLHATDENGSHPIMTRDFDIDTSVTDSVTHEFSLDFLASEDCEIFWELSENVQDIGVVDSMGMNIHRIYSGINAVPGTCATKEWVSENFQPLSGMSSYVPYSAIEHNVGGEVTGINGSAIAGGGGGGGVDSATVSAIASSYAESAASSKQDISGMSAWIPWSSSGVFQPSGNYQTAGDYAYNSSLSSKLDASASGNFVLNSSFSAWSSNVDSSISSFYSSITSIENNITSISSDMSAYVPFSGLEGDGTMITGISGSAIAGGVNSAVVSSIASSIASAYTESAFSSISAWTADLSSISSKADQSSLTAYQPVSAMSAYATEAYVDAAVGEKLDATASSLFLTGLPDDLATTGDVASAVSGKLDKSASGEFYPMTGNPSGFLTAHQSLAGLATVEYVDSSVSSKLDTSAFASASGNFVQNSSMTSWIPYSALDYSGTAISGIGGSSLAGMGGGDYTGVYPVNVDNEAREIAVDSLPLVTDSSMTAYWSEGSSVIGVNPDILSGKQDTLAFGYDTANKISSIDGSALAGGGGMVTSIQSALDPYGQKSISGINGSSIYPKWVLSAKSAGTAQFANQAASALYAPTAWASSFISSVTSPSGTIRVLDGNKIEGTNSAVLPSIVVAGFNVQSSQYNFKSFSFTVPVANPNTMVFITGGWVDGVVTISSDNGLIHQSSMHGPLNVSLSMPGATAFNVTSEAWIGNAEYTASASASEVGGGVAELAWKSALPSYSYDGSGNISAIDGSAIGGQGGVDSATVSAIASAYVESGVSGKLDITAFNSGDFQTTAGMTAYIPTSLSSDFQHVTGMSSYALSADVSGTVDLVSTQSANWGGSALQLSAGPGISLTMVGSTLVISTAGV